MSPDFKEILSIFNEHEVRYLIVGAHAVIKYAELRFTRDRDIWIEASPENADRVFKALDRFGAPLGGVTASEFAFDGFFHGPASTPSRYLMSIDGVDLAAAWRNRQPGDFDGVPANFIGLDDLLANKTAFGRPQDLIDIDSLRAAGTSREER